MDTERELAKNKLLAQLVAIHGEGSEVVRQARRGVNRLSDADLRRKLALSKLLLDRRSRGFSAVQRQAVMAMAARAKAPASMGVDDAADLLREVFDIEVAGDGLVECGRLTDEAREVIGDLPVAMYHHTSSALYPQIASQGLIVGRQTNFFNTQAGVYVSTMRAGCPVETYGQRSARVNGGEPVAIRVRRLLSELTPDPDDADLAWAQGRQYITSSVPPTDLADPEVQAAVEEQQENEARRARDLRHHPGWMSEAETEDRP